MSIENTFTVTNMENASTYATNGATAADGIKRFLGMEPDADIGARSETFNLANFGTLAGDNLNRVMVAGDTVFIYERAVASAGVKGQS